MNATAAQVNAALRARYCAPEWAVAFEVGESTGARARRRADCLAMNCYPSRGLEVHGVEVKVWRGDWRRELKNPDKAEEGVFRYCDRWWVAAPKGLVPPDELPEGWGLLEYEDGILTQRVKAAKLQPAPLSRPFVASFLRSVGAPGEAELREMVQRELEPTHKRHREEMDGQAKRHQLSVERHVKNERLFTQMFGKPLDWLSEAEAAELAGFVRLAGSLSSEGRTSALREVRARLAEVARGLDSALAAASALNPLPSQEAQS